MSDNATSYDQAADIDRFNGLLDAVTEKLFVSPTVFIQTLRAACDLHGISLPAMKIEGGNGPSPEDGKYVLAGISSPANPDMYAPPTEAEYVLKIEDRDGNIQDAYLYIIVDQTEDGLYHCFAQIVDDEDLYDLLTMEEPAPSVEIDNHWQTIMRHAKGTNPATTIDMDDGPPLD